MFTLIDIRFVYDFSSIDSLFLDAIPFGALVCFPEMALVYTRDSILRNTLEMPSPEVEERTNFSNWVYSGDRRNCNLMMSRSKSDLYAAE